MCFDADALAYGRKSAFLKVFPVRRFFFISRKTFIEIKMQYA
jgi:hypothetical protein